MLGCSPVSSNNHASTSSTISLEIFQQYTRNSTPWFCTVQSVLPTGMGWCWTTDTITSNLLHHLKVSRRLCHLTVMCAMSDFHNINIDLLRRSAYPSSNSSYYQTCSGPPQNISEQCFFFFSLHVLVGDVPTLTGAGSSCLTLRWRVCYWELTLGNTCCMAWGQCLTFDPFWGACWDKTGRCQSRMAAVRMDHVWCMEACAAT